MKQYTVEWMPATSGSTYPMTETVMAEVVTSDPAGSLCFWNYDTSQAYTANAMPSLVLIRAYGPGVWRRVG